MFASTFTTFVTTVPGLSSRAPYREMDSRENCPQSLAFTKSKILYVKQKINYTKNKKIPTYKPSKPIVIVINNTTKITRTLPVSTDMSSKLFPQFKRRDPLLINR